MGIVLKEDNPKDKDFDKDEIINSLKYNIAALHLRIEALMEDLFDKTKENEVLVNKITDVYKIAEESSSCTRRYRLLLEATEEELKIANNRLKLLEEFGMIQQ